MGEDSRFEVYGSGFGIEDQGFTVVDSACRVQGLAFGISAFRVQGSGGV